MCHNDRNSILLFLWDGLGFDAWFKLALNEVLDESADLLLSELVALEGVLLVLDGLLDGERWEGVGGEVEVGSVSTKGFGVNGSKIELAPVLLCNRLEGLGELSSLFRGLCEDIC